MTERETEKNPSSLFIYIYFTNLLPNRELFPLFFSSYFFSHPARKQKDGARSDENFLYMIIILYTTKGGSRRLEKSHKVWMIMMIDASLMWAGAAEKPE